MKLPNNMIHLPSIVGVGNTDMGLLSGNYLGSNKNKKDEPLIVSWGGQEYIVGTGVERYTRPIERMDFSRLADGAELQALTYAALGQILEPDKVHEIHLMIGYPVEVMMDKQRAVSMLRALINQLLGGHCYGVNEATYQVDIKGIQIAAQPAGAYFTWSLNDKGELTKSRQELETSVGICDVGFNTVDLLTIQGGQIIGRHTGGETNGVRRAADILIQLVRNQYKVQLSRHQADELLRSSYPLFACAEGEFNLIAQTSQALDAASAGIVSTLETIWDNGQSIRHILCTGGGSQLFRKSLLKQYPTGQILPDPVMANALGLARYGMRVFKKAGTVIGLDPGFGGIKAVRLDRTDDGH